jgi:hypothetical protein
MKTEGLRDGADPTDPQTMPGEVKTTNPSIQPTDKK